MSNKENLPAVNIPDVLEKINEKLASLKKITDSVYKTSGELGNGFGNIKNELKIQNLISLFSAITSKEAAYEKAAKDLNVNPYPEFSVNGFTVADCKSDIKLRIDILSHQEQLDKLNKAKDLVSKFLSEEDQKRMALEQLKDILG
jgi:hypothetical protein